MPSNRLFKALNGAHRGLLKISGGGLGWTAGKMPVLEITTIGRRSGNLRPVILTSPHQEGDTFVIVASKGGSDTHPAWFLNLRENPQVAVTTKGVPERKMTARVVSPEERDRLWPIVTRKYANYAGYQKKTDREIPLVILEPAP